MATIKERQDVLVEEFEFFDEWMDKYNHIIEMGKSLDALPEEKKNDDLLCKAAKARFGFTLRRTVKM